MLCKGIAPKGRRFITVGRETMCKSSPERQFMPTEQTRNQKLFLRPILARDSVGDSVGEFRLPFLFGCIPARAANESDAVPLALKHGFL